MEGDMGFVPVIVVAVLFALALAVGFVAGAIVEARMERDDQVRIEAARIAADMAGHDDRRLWEGRKET
jgi:hypothetical protein